MASLLPELASYGASPSRSGEQGLRAIAEQLEAMALGNAAPKVYLSSLDPGIGKTSVIRHFMRVLLRSPGFEEVSVLVCLSRLNEVQRMVEALAEVQHEIAVWTGDEACNGLTAAKPGSARVLITTQQKLQAASRRHRRFDDICGLHYQGDPRQIRIWDESLLPGEEVVLGADDLAGLVAGLVKQAPKLSRSLDTLRDQFKRTAKGDTLWIPDLTEMAGVQELPLIQSRRSTESLQGLDKDRLDRLRHFAGQTWPVFVNSFGVAHVFDHRDTLPEGLWPLLVLDASGRCRETYSVMERERGILERMPAGVKDYRNLEVHVWHRGSGKASHQNNTKGDLMEGVAEAILRHPDEEWLVVCHKGMKRFQEELLSRLDGVMTGRLHVIHWGQHHGTNAYANVPNVILASLCFLPDEVYAMRHRLCAGVDHTAAVSCEDLGSMKLGEVLDNVLQALCRGRIRGMQGATCPPCRAYIIAAKRHGLWEEIPNLFPGCQRKEWRPSGTSTMPRKAVEALAQIRSWRDDGIGDEITYAELAKIIGMDPKDFKKRIAKHTSFQDGIADMGYCETTIPRSTSKGVRNTKGITTKSSAFAADPDATYTA